MANSSKRALSKSTRIKLMLVLNMAFFVVELTAGTLVHSLALTADAFHMLSDIISLGVGLWAVVAAQKKTTDDFTFGFARAEILGAFFNAVFLIALCVSVIIKALLRFLEPSATSNPMIVLIIACCGLLSNLLGFVVLGGHGHAHGHSHDHDDEYGHDYPQEGASSTTELNVQKDGQDAEKELSADPLLAESDTELACTESASASDAYEGLGNILPHKASSKGTCSGREHADMGMNAMMLHVLGDALGNVGVIVSALIMWLTEWQGKAYADPAVSLFITAIILKTSFPLTLRTARILLQATPQHISVQSIRLDIEAVPCVQSCHDIHVWQLSGTRVVASLSIKVSSNSVEEYMQVERQARECLDGYGIHSATIQADFCLNQKPRHNTEAATFLELEKSDL